MGSCRATVKLGSRDGNSWWVRQRNKVRKGDLKVVAARVSDLAKEGPLQINLVSEGLQINFIGRERDTEILDGSRALVDSMPSGVGDIKIGPDLGERDTRALLQIVRTKPLRSWAANLSQYGVEIKGPGGESTGMPVRWTELYRDIVSFRRELFYADGGAIFGWGLGGGALAFFSSLVVLQKLDELPLSKRPDFIDSFSSDAIGWGITIGTALLFGLGRFLVDVVPTAARNSGGYAYRLAAFPFRHRLLSQVASGERQARVERLRNILGLCSRNLLPEVTRNWEFALLERVLEDRRFAHQRDELLVSNNKCPRERLVGFLDNSNIEVRRVAYHRIGDTLTEKEAAAVTGQAKLRDELLAASQHSSRERLVRLAGSPRHLSSIRRIAAPRVAGDLTEAETRVIMKGLGRERAAGDERSNLEIVLGILLSEGIAEALENPGITRTVYYRFLLGQLAGELIPEVLGRIFDSLTETEIGDIADQQSLPAILRRLAEHPSISAASMVTILLRIIQPTTITIPAEGYHQDEEVLVGWSTDDRGYPANERYETQQVWHQTAPAIHSFEYQASAIAEAATLLNGRTSGFQAAVVLAIRAEKPDFADNLAAKLGMA
ncbi:MAG: hypothetical protein HQ596_04270 [Candidatus Saganbacteria bacterium]|nr:hypothetical protein [Candidatus Saganbacteria bacterium]